MGISVKNLTHIYNEGLPHESVALDNVSFEINDGEFIGIIGHTGSGKSTLLQHLNGLLKPKSGQIIVGDTDITDPSCKLLEIRRRIGLVFQYPEYQLFEETVAKDVAFGPKNLGLAQDEIDKRVEEAIGLVGLPFEEIREKSPFELSGGQKRRVAIAGVVAMKPEVLILDEPTAGLDPKAHKDVLEMAYNIHKHEKNITIFVSHNMADIAKLCDRVFVMDKGKLVLSGTPEEVFAEEERLTSIGLSLPPAAQLMHRLHEANHAIKAEVFDAENAAEEIFKFLGDKVC